MTLTEKWLPSVCKVMIGSLVASVSASQTLITELIDSSGDGAGNGLDGGIGVDVDAFGSVYVSGSRSHTVFKVEADGSIHLLLDSSGDGDTHPLEFPAHVCVDDLGNLYVPGTGSNNVFRVTPGGQVTELIDWQGDGVHPLQNPSDVAVDSAGNVFVIGAVSDNAFKVSATGVITKILDATGVGPGRGLDFPSRIDVDEAGNVYVLGRMSHNVFRVAADGTITELMDASGAGPGFLLGSPRGLAVGPSGDLFVSGKETAYSSIFRITEGGVITVYHQEPDSTIWGLAVDPIGRLYYALDVFWPGDGDGIYRLDPDGTVTLIIDASGDGMGNELRGLAAGLAVDEGYSVYVGGQLTNNVFRVSCGPSTEATATPYNGSGVNLETLTASKVVIGADWTATIDPLFVRGPGSWVLLMRGEGSAGTILDLGTFFGLPAAGDSELLVNLASPFGLNFFPAPHVGNGIPTTFTAAVPTNCDLVGQSWFAQAIVFGALPTGPGALDPWFSSAVGGVIGNQ